MSHTSLGFWALSLLPGKEIIKEVDVDFVLKGAVLIVQAPEGAEKVNGDGPGDLRAGRTLLKVKDYNNGGEFVLASLCTGATEQVSLDLTLTEGEKIGFTCLGTNGIDLHGMYINQAMPMDDEDIDSDDEDSEEDEDDNYDSEEDEDYDIDEKALKEYLKEAHGITSDDDSDDGVPKLVELGEEDEDEDEDDDSEDDDSDDDEALDEEEEADLIAALKEHIRTKNKKGKGKKVDVEDEEDSEGDEEDDDDDDEDVDEDGVGDEDEDEELLDAIRDHLENANGDDEDEDEDEEDDEAEMNDDDEDDEDLEDEDEDDLEDDDEDNELLEKVGESSKTKLGKHALASPDPALADTGKKGKRVISQELPESQKKQKVDEKKSKVINGSSDKPESSKVGSQGAWLDID